MEITDKLFQSLRSKKSEDEKEHDVLRCLEEGANVNATDAKKKNNTPLHIAVQNSDYKIIKLLLNKNADVTLKNDLNQNPLELANSLPEVDDDIVMLLSERYNEINVTPKVSKKIDNVETIDSPLLIHEKREGTASGLTGQFYETKLLSLILFRCLTDETVDNFYLGTNVKDVGDLDDVCLKYKLKGECRSRMLFIQAKHREQRGAANKITLDDLKNSDDFKLTKYFESYKKIREKFQSDKDIMFEGSYEDVECDFVIFTPSINDIDNKYKINSITFGHRFEKFFCSRENLISISADPQFNKINETFQISDKNLLLDQIIESQIESLSEILKAHILNNNDQTYKKIMLKDLVKRYHVVLAQKVFQVGEITDAKPKDHCAEVLEDCGEGTSKGTFNKINQVTKNVAPTLSKDKKNTAENPLERYRIGTFRPDFFQTKDKMLRCLREKMFKNISKLEIETYKNKPQKEFKLPKCFGNLDLTVSDNINKKTKRVEYLTRTIVKLANISKETKVIRINKSIFEKNYVSNKKEDQISDGFLDNDGGIAGLVGNLLVIDNETKMFHLNNNEDKLNENSKLLLNELKKQFQEQFGDINILFEFSFDINMPDFPKFSFDCDEYEKLLVNDYLSKLWFLTNQCQQNELQTIIKMEMECQYRTENQSRLLRIYSDAIFLKFHDKIQEWWMTKKSSYYKTITCPYYKEAMEEIVKSPRLTILNFITINNVRKNQNIQFKNDAVEILGLNAFLCNANTNILNIYSTDNFLSILKLAQFFENKENTTFLDFEYVLENGYYEMIKSEFQTTELNAFVFFQKKGENIKQLCQIISDLISFGSKKKVILVTQNNIADTIKSQCNMECMSQTDDKCDLNDILDCDTASQNWTLVFQGQEVKFDRVIEGESKRLVNSHILTKLINNETVEIGKPLANKRYDEVKQYCIPRNLTRGEEHLIKTFKDINENVVLIESEPGMGKSVLMNQLAIRTKEFEESYAELSSWIAYINLRDYSSEFKMWKENNLHITKNEAIRFICKTAINNLGMFKSQQKNIRGQKSDLNAFKITFDRDNVHLKSFIKDKKVLFELQLFIEYYNKGNVILIFDGFDEICPQYEKQVSSLLKELTRSYHSPECELWNPLSLVQNALSVLQQKSSTTCNCPLMGSNQLRIWVTTRSYSNIKNALETELGRNAFTLKPLSKEEQTTYLEQYFEINFSLLDLTEEDIIELNEFLDYMLTTLSDESRHIAMVSVPLYTVYATSVKYFQRKFSEDTFEDTSIDIKCLRDKCVKAYSVLTSFGPVFERQQNIRELTAISENPLHLYMAAEYFCSQIKDHDIINQRPENVQQQKKWDVNLKSFDLFEKFLDTKFRKIRFEEKNEVNTSMSDNDFTLQREKEVFVEKHKKMALCAIFDRKDLKHLLPENLFDEFDEIMIKIDTGEEKTGVIVTVIDKVPRFVHLVFAEYFAIEYIGDLLKKASKSEIEHPALEELWRFIMNIVLYKSTGGVRTFFDHKLRNDTDLIELISSEQNKMIVFKSLLKQGRENQMTPEGFNSLFTVLRTSLNIAVEESLFDIQNYMFNCIRSSLNKENVNEFTEITANSLLVFSALGTNNDDFIHRLRACLYFIDSSDELFVKMLIPTFAREVIPFNISADTFMATWKMLSCMIPQLASINLETAEITPTFRYAIMDYVRLLRDLISNAYHF